MKKKDQKILSDSQSQKFPIFIICAKDVCAIETLQEYLTLCSLEGCSHDHRVAVQDRIDEFREWQKQNPDKVKIPD